MRVCFDYTKLFPLTVLAFCALVGAQMLPPSIGGFGGSCFLPTHIYSEPFMGIYCNNRNVYQYGYNWTWIDLRACVGNAQGQLFGTTAGDYTLSCGNCTLALDANWALDNSLYLRCNCLTSAGAFPYTAVDLNGFIYNSDGTMGCFGQLGNQTLAGPLPIPTPR